MLLRSVRALIQHHAVPAGAVAAAGAVPVIQPWSCTACRHLSVSPSQATASGGSSSSSSATPQASDPSTNSSTPWEVSRVAVFQEQVSRGFGGAGKAALPAEAALRQIVVAAPEGPVDLLLRAYHVGSRVHISRVLANVRQTHPLCRTTAGRDYAVIWLDDIPAPDHTATALKNVLWALEQLPRSLGWSAPLTLGAIARLRQQIDNMQPTSSAAPAATSAWNLRQFSPRTKQQTELITIIRPGGNPAAATGIAASALSAQQAAQERSPPQQPQQPPPQQQAVTQRLSLQPPFMAVYRSGSVVFGGLPQREELLWLGQLVPASVRYTRDTSQVWEWSKGRSGPTIAYQDSLKVVVDASCPAYAAQGDDEMRLRVLDVGGVRVLTSVLAQSAALRSYEESVKHSLEQLAAWRASHTMYRAGMRSGMWGSSHLSWFDFRDFLFGSKQDKVLFKVIAASALIINEAQQLLEVAEPAWQYDAYNSLWELLAKDQQLEGRLTNLEIKLHQVEHEAKQDVKARAGRRSRKLDQGIILLLFVSCLLAAFEAGMKMNGHLKGRPAGSTRGSAHKAAACADS